MGTIQFIRKLNVSQYANVYVCTGTCRLVLLYKWPVRAVPKYPSKPNLFKQVTMYKAHLESLVGNNIASTGATFPGKSGKESRECVWSGWEGEVAWVWRVWQWVGPLVVDGETLVGKEVRWIKILSH